MSFDKLIEKIVFTQNPTVVGLDPNLAFIPEYIKESFFSEFDDPLEAASQAVLEFNKALIDELNDIVPAVKPQSAYYEMLGYHGVRALYDTVEYARQKGMYVILDGKRNDIGTTMEAYTAAYLGSININGKRCEPFSADALTVNGYLGYDGIKPLVEQCMLDKDKGFFVLVKTSNSSSGELQDVKTQSGQTVYEIMGGLCEKWGELIMGAYGYSGVGAVVGATYPEVLAEQRQKMPHTFFLVPGYGAQGGGVKDIIGAFDNRGLGAIVNSSRAIMCAYKKKNMNETDFAKAAREEAIDMKNQIISCIGKIIF